MNLPAVLAGIGVIGALAAAIASAGFNAPVLPARTLAEAQTTAHLEAVVSRVAYALYDVRPQHRPATDGTPIRVDFDRAAFAVTLADELGRIDLNNADATAIGGIFMVAGADAGL